MVTDALVRDSSVNFINSLGNAVEKRYRDAFKVANAIIFFGETIKVGGIVAGFIVATAIGYVGHTPATIAIGVVAGLVIAASGWCTGVIVAAIGQLMQSVVDTAVNTSPLLLTFHKAKLLGLELEGEDRFSSSGGNVGHTQPEPSYSHQSPEWIKLSEQYRHMSDEQLESLAQTELMNLTEIARQVLMDELRRRGLSNR